MIEFRSINLSFSGKSIIENLSFKINRGDKVVISGKSGCGKSSLLSLVLGFIQPSSGRIFFDGQAIDESSIWNVRKRISYVDQNVSIGQGRVKELFDFISVIRANSDTSSEIEKLMVFFSMDIDLISKNIEELSGGERQRIAIIIAILLNREVFFLDEVTSSLDKQLKKKIADYFIEDKKTTCVIVSHDPVWVSNSAIRIFNLEEKKWKLQKFQYTL